jgi:hypothetical protein
LHQFQPLDAAGGALHVRFHAAQHHVTPAANEIRFNALLHDVGMHARCDGFDVAASTRVEVLEHDLERAVARTHAVSHRRTPSRRGSIIPAHN